MMRLLRIIFSPRSERHDAVTRRVHEASERQERASNMLLSAVKELLEERDSRAVVLRVHTRKR